MKLIHQTKHPREYHNNYRNYLDSEPYVQKRLDDLKNKRLPVYTVVIVSK